MKPLNEQAYHHLQKLIMTNQLSYGKIYSETKLSKEIGISRTPFRDAVHRLAQEGYIDIIPSKGFTLHQLTVKDVDETFQVRSALECYCTLQIAKNADTESVKKLIGELKQIMKKLKEILDTTRSIDDFYQYDYQFHALIIAYVENDKFASLFDVSKYRMRRLAKLSLAHAGRMQDTYEEHQAIVKAMEEGDVEHIYEITARHMEIARNINMKDL